MTEKKAPTAKSQALHRSAEKILSGRSPDREDRQGEDRDRLVHDLKVHQIELELQNEELKRARSELQQARDNYADLYEFAPLGYLSIDQDNVIRKANHMASQLLDPGGRGLAGKRFTRFIDRASMDIYYLHGKKALETGLKQDCEFTMHKAGGDSFYARLESIAAHDGQLRVAIIDLTRHRQLEEDLKKQTAELEAANRELESFNYSIAHDLRSPLRAIEGFSLMLLKTAGSKFDDEETRKMGIIRNNARKMAQLIDDLLAFSRLGRQAMSLSDINMEDLVRQVWGECCKDDIEGRAEVMIKPLPRAYGDAGLVGQVLWNLLTNAVKFTRLQKNALIEIGGREEGGEKVYYVKDNGIGFDMEYKDRLFGVFQRLHGDDEFEGTGVGLAIAQRIIHRHGGRIWAEGIVNGGAIFSFTLPEKKEEVLRDGGIKGTPY